MKLAIFDVDGTLTRTYEADQVCFARACKSEFRFEDPDLADWARYRTSTDSGITQEVFEQQAGRPPTADELARLQDKFMGLLDAAWRENPQDWGEVPGAGRLLERLQADGEWAVAIATGCKEASARFKLRVAGLELGEIPMACSDTMLERAEIVEAARDAARRMCGQDSFEKTVYIGDGIWDVRAARQIGLAFLGIGSGPRAAALREEGAMEIHDDFTNLEGILMALETAACPNGAGD